MVVIATTSRRAPLWDAVLYGLSAAFAGITALTATLLPHRFWGALSWPGYALAFVLSLVFLFFPLFRLFSRFGPLGRRVVLAAVTWVWVAIVPAVVESVQRAGGRTDRAQDEVLVVERMGERLLHTGTPYLSRTAIGALPPDDRLLGYSPYQPGMAVFGLPRAWLGEAWFTDARIWFAVVALTSMIFSGVLLSRRFAGPGLLRAAQLATVLPLCALTLATGGDDIPVLSLTLLAIALAARGRWGWCGVAVGAAGALKLFAWPVILVLLVFALRPASRVPAGSSGWSLARIREGLLVRDGLRVAGWLRVRDGLWFSAGGVGLPVLVMVPAFLVSPDGFVENVLRFPAGRGLVTSPAQSPLPGYLIAAHLPAGHTVALGLLVLAGVAIAGWLLLRPPPDVSRVALVSAVGLTAAIMLTPSTRYGYLLYSVAYLGAWWALRSPCPRTATGAAEPPR